MRITARSIEFLVILSDLQFQLLNSLGHAQHLLLKCGFVRLQIAKLLLESLTLCLLVAVMAGNILNHSVQLVSQGFSGVLAFHRQN